MLKNLLKKKQSVIFTWLFSYILVLIVPIVVTAITYSETVKVVENEVNNSNSHMLKIVQQQMDRQLNDAGRLADEISLNSRIIGLTMEHGNIRDVANYNIYQAVQDLRNYSISNSSVGDFYIYFNQLDLVISSYASSDSKSFYKTYIKDTGLSYEYWLEIISGQQKGSNIFSLNTMRLGKAYRNIFYLRSIPFINQGKPLANIIIIMDEKKFMDDVAGSEPQSAGAVVVLDKKNNIITSSKTVKGIELLKYEDLNKDRGMLYSRLEGKRYVISYTTSKMTEWKYVDIMPFSDFWDKANYIKRLTAASILLCILLGGLITYFSLKKNYNPIIKLVKQLETRQGYNFERSNNEYQYIQQVLDRIHADQEKADTILKQQNRELRSQLITRLLKGRIGANLPLSDMLSVNGIHLRSEDFAVMALYIEDLEDVFPEEVAVGAAVDAFDKFKMVQFIITNVVEEIIAQNNNQGFITDMDDMLVCMVNFGTGGAEKAKEEIARIIMESQAFLNKHFDINFMVAASSTHKGIVGIPEAYNEALQALEYKRVLGIEGIIHYEDIIGLPKGNYYYPLEVEQKLINSIKIGDFDTSKNILEEIFQKNFEKSYLSVKIARCLMFNLVSTMIKTVSDANSNGSNEFVENLNPVEKLLSCSSIIEMKHEMIRILNTFCGYIKSKGKSKNKGVDENLIEKIVAYVHENYQDINLGVTQIANMFNVHLVQLSKAFKEQTGEGLLDYISKVRVEKAKGLLVDAVNLEDVAKSVGYTNIRTFSRVFKKYEGITAGKFKDMK